MARSNPAVAIKTPVAALPDPRIQRSRLHDLMDSVVSALCAVSGGSEGWEDIAK
jgi:DDE_Tnp_1-associated